ncbi:hypothetical protein DQK91_23345, partial [Oceanidesulfovibrio marinus]
KESFAGEDRINVESFDTMLAEYAIERGAKAILRGRSAVSDFEVELQIALRNRQLNRQVKNVFLMKDYRWLYISSTIIKEAARAGGDVRGLVPDPVYFRLKERLGRQVDTTEGMIECRVPYIRTPVRREPSTGGSPPGMA